MPGLFSGEGFGSFKPPEASAPTPAPAVKTSKPTGSAPSMSDVMNMGGYNPPAYPVSQFQFPDMPPGLNHMPQYASFQAPSQLANFNWRMPMPQMRASQAQAQENAQRSQVAQQMMMEDQMRKMQEAIDKMHHHH
jgi:hypothetical protein